MSSSIIFRSLLLVLMIIVGPPFSFALSLSPPPRSLSEFVIFCALILVSLLRRYLNSLVNFYRFSSGFNRKTCANHSILRASTEYRNLGHDDIQTTRAWRILRFSGHLHGLPEGGGAIATRVEHAANAWWA
ncbi:hypothetical protein BXZ70DRAFT_466358 [Cristinia sonorae]|uniref:Secreted protein n=1 Tax=Cristinia sonorae TaxID=1940300 RepID=A0A8K0UHC7_9AGAR|nr:hypothetical protein BXZ70DRAFT_466358 [Cristinia sonorae]